MKFPSKKYHDLKSFFNDYNDSYSSAINSVNLSNLSKAINILKKAYKKGKNKVLICGNGGSAALANHFACDHQKILYESKYYNPFVLSLSSNSPLMTAISNDNKYENIFSNQINFQGKKNDILITISSSGNSENIVRAIKVAKKNKLKTISLTGFSGGRSKNISDINIHVKSYNYGIIETAHQSIMNLISQYLKNIALNKNKIKKTIF